MPDDMSRQNILYHVRKAEKEGWVATFASSLELTPENKVLFREEFMDNQKEKVSAQRFVVSGTNTFESVRKDEIINICKKASLEPLSLMEEKILRIVSVEAMKKMNSSKEKKQGNTSLFMVLLRLGWLWMNINPEYTQKIVETIKTNEKKHNYNNYYRQDVELLSLSSAMELQEIPQLEEENIKELLQMCMKNSNHRNTKAMMNLMAITLLIAGRYLRINDNFFIAKEILNRGIKYIRHCKRHPMLLRKLHLDGLFDLAYVYSLEGWFYKALGIYENIERLIEEEFKEDEPTTAIKGRLAAGRAELYLMIAFPSYSLQEENYKNFLKKAHKYSRIAHKHYKNRNDIKDLEMNLLSAWISALQGRLLRAKRFLNIAEKRMNNPMPSKLKIIYYNAIAEINRKKEDYEEAIINISHAFDYSRIIGHTIANLFLLMRKASIHIKLSYGSETLPIISYGNVSSFFQKNYSVMLSHIFLEYNQQLAKQKCIITFYLNEEVIENHPEINDYIELKSKKLVPEVMFEESFTILPKHLMKNEDYQKGKFFCITGRPTEKGLDKNVMQSNIFKQELNDFDTLFLKLKNSEYEK
jgi:hypothetical protein